MSAIENEGCCMLQYTKNNNSVTAADHHHRDNKLHVNLFDIQQKEQQPNNSNKDITRIINQLKMQNSTRTKTNEATP